ncbi:hypothetical protein M1146_02370 [Patescibacteria group bacterium]|nr:hypothetical protein [Patescibacteria group bacterium]
MKQKDILFLLASTVIIVLLWIIFSVYHNLAVNTISTSTTMQIIPINPDFDTKTIENLKKREKILPIYEIRNTAGSESAATAIPETTRPIIRTDILP